MQWPPLFSSTWLRRCVSICLLPPSPPNSFAPQTLNKYCRRRWTLVATNGHLRHSLVGVTPSSLIEKQVSYIKFVGTIDSLKKHISWS